MGTIIHIILLIAMLTSARAEESAQDSNADHCESIVRLQSLNRFLSLFPIVKDLIVLTEKSDCARKLADLLVQRKMEDFTAVTIYRTEFSNSAVANATLEMLLILPKKIHYLQRPTILWLSNWSSTVSYFVVMKKIRKWNSISKSNYRHLVFPLQNDVCCLRDALPEIYVEGLRLFLLIGPYKKNEGNEFNQNFSQNQKEILLFVSSTSTGSMVVKNCLFNEMTTILSTFCNPSEEDVYRNFQGRQLTVCTVNDLPYSDIIRNGNKQYFWQVSLDRQIIYTLAEHLNFRVTALLPEALNNGSAPFKNTWKNLIVIVNEKKADLAIGYLSMTPKRMPLVDFSIPYFSENTVVISPAPHELSRTFIVYKPFTPGVWLAVFTCSMAASLVLCLFSIFARLSTSEPNQRRNRFAYIGWRLGQSVWFVFTTIVNQIPDSSSALPTRSRLLLLFWGFFILMLAACYQGTLTSYMTFPLKDSAIENLQELSAKMDTVGYKWTIPDGTSYVDLFNEVEDGILYELRSKMPGDSFVSPLVTSPENIKKVASTPKLAFFVGRKVAEYEASVVGRHKLHIGTGGFAFQQYAIALQKDAPYRRRIDIVIRRLVEAGLIDHWLQSIISRAYKSNSSIDDNRISRKRNIKIDDVQGAFLLLMLGYSFSCFVFFFEFCMYQKRKSLVKKL